MKNMVPLITVLIWWVNCCPYPAVATLEAMPQLKKGNPGSGQAGLSRQWIDHIPLDARNHGYTVLESSKTGRPFVI